MDLVLSHYKSISVFGFMSFLLPRIHLLALRSRLPTLTGSGKAYTFTTSLHVCFDMRRSSVDITNVGIKKLRGTTCNDEDVELI
jgi:hypothetical protein